MEKNKYRMFLAVLLVGLVFITWGIQKLNKPVDTTEISIKEDVDIKEGKVFTDKSEEDSTWMTKSQIKDLQNQIEDNQSLDNAENIEIVFIGYEENPAEFGWMLSDEWESFQESLKRYLINKGMADVTVVRLHPDSIHKINDYERYVYLDVDYKNDYTDRIVIKAICDTYKEEMRFAFEVQYGDC